MKLKLDENLGHGARVLLEAAGHDVATVHDESLCSAPDDRILQVSREEQRCLVTLDLEFGNPLRYRAADYAGIAVLQPAIARHLWIIEAQRIRIYQDPDEDPLGDGFEGDSA